MARITVEDCLKKIDSQYDLVMLAKERTSQLNAGDPLLVPQENDKNTWMAEDAVAKRKNILVVDDINDTGATFKWIKHDWCINDNMDNVRFAVLTENLSSEFEEVKYWAHEVNKAEEDVWLVYPWENVGSYKDD